MDAREWPALVPELRPHTCTHNIHTDTQARVRECKALRATHTRTLSPSELGRPRGQRVALTLDTNNGKARAITATSSALRGLGEPARAPGQEAWAPVLGLPFLARGSGPWAPPLWSSISSPFRTRQALGFTSNCKILFLLSGTSPRFILQIGKLGPEGVRPLPGTTQPGNGRSKI